MTLEKEVAGLAIATVVGNFHTYYVIPMSDRFVVFKGEIIVGNYIDAFVARTACNVLAATTSLDVMGDICL